MFRKQTTFVVGAGASCELGLPSGEGLKGSIASLLAPSRDNGYRLSNATMQRAMSVLLARELQQNWASLEPFTAAADRIRRGLPLAMSIDNYLHTHQHDTHVVRMGKVAVGLSILAAERSSHLFGGSFYTTLLDERREVKPSLESKELAGSWYPAFASLLMSQVQKSNIRAAFRNVRFIIFNYDRCLEQYLWMALQDYFDIDGRAAAEALSEVEFLHPYGSLGPLPWQVGRDEAVSLGQNELDDPWIFVNRIRTFTESVADETTRAVKNAMLHAEVIVVLGSGYLDQNLQLITPSGEKTVGRVISTAYGVSQPDQDVMRLAMQGWARATGGILQIEAGSCRDLFDHYRLTLNLT